MVQELPAESAISNALNNNIGEIINKNGQVATITDEYPCDPTPEIISGSRTVDCEQSFQQEEGSNSGRCETCQCINRWLPERRLDGGWGWVIMVSSFICIAVVDGVTFSFGVIYPKLVEAFDGNETATSLVGSILNGMYMCAGPFASALCARVGYRTVAVTGSLLSAAAFFGSSFSNSVTVMIVTYGFLAGTGFCFQFLASMVCTTLYFEKRQALAVGVASCGSGVGIFLFPFLIRKLLDSMSWQSCVRIQAGIVLLGAVAGFLFRPPPNEDKKEKSTFCSTLKAVLDINLFRRPTFPLILAMALLATTGIFVIFVFIPSFAVQHGISESKSALLVSIMGGTNTAGRFLVGLMLNKWPALHPLLVLGVGTIIGGLVTCFAAFFTNFPLLVSYAAMFGLVYALDAALSTIILSRSLGADRVRGAFGLVCLFRGVSASSAGPIAGSLVGVRGFYVDVFYLGGACVIATGLICLLTWVCERKREGNFDLKNSSGALA